MKKFYIIAAAFAMALTACDNTEEPAGDDPVPVKVTASIGATSRVVNTSWHTNDKIGITTFRTENDVTTSKYVNMEYTTTADNGSGFSDGVFTGNTMFFQDKTIPVTFRAYYPFNGKEGIDPGVITASTSAENQSVEGKKSIDFLWDEEVAKAEGEHAVKFNFTHRMSKLQITFKQGAGADLTNITSYVIDGLKMNGSFDTSDGTAAATGDAASLKMEVALTADDIEHDNTSVPALILFPQEISAGDDNQVRLTIKTKDNHEYGCTLSFVKDDINDGKNALAAGYFYTYTITVNKTNLVVNASTITPWNPVSLSGEATLK